MLDRNEIRKTDTNIVTKINGKIAALLRGGTSFDPQLGFVLNYGAYIAYESGISGSEELLEYIERNISEERAMFVKQIAGENLNISFLLIQGFDKDAFLLYMLIFSKDNSSRNFMEFGTPESLSKLALRILNIHKKDTVADFGCGVGDFITTATESHHMKSIFGIDINTYSCEISKIRSELFAENAEIVLGDMFSLSKDMTFDKIFSNYPFGLRRLHIQAGEEYIEKLYKRMPEIMKATSSDWFFNSLIVDHLNENGKAVAIMTNGSTWNSIDQKIREHFIKNGLIESIILLPARLFEFTNISTTMIVLSRNNDFVRMIDATEICEQGRRQNYLTDSNIKKIVRLLTEDGDEAITVDVGKLKENDYVLNPSRYLTKTVKIEDGVQFGSLMRRITRGAPLKASVLDEMVSEDPTDTQYLMLADIKNGMIAEELPYLKELDSKLDKYCIQNRNLLLSKNGAPFKVAVAEVEAGRKLLGNGNLFIIELDEVRVNPYYIKAFFDSEAGTAALNSIVVGASIPNISAESLKKLIVPLPPMEKQNEIANLYQAKQDEIKVLELKIQRAQNDLRGIFGEVE